MIVTKENSMMNSLSSEDKVNFEKWIEDHSSLHADIKGASKLNLVKYALIMTWKLDQIQLENKDLKLQNEDLQFQIKNTSHSPLIPMAAELRLEKIQSTELQFHSAILKHDLEKQKAGLKKGNSEASKSKSAKADAYHELWKTWAKETWKVHPYWTVDKVAEHVFVTANNKDHKMANGKPYEIKTIIKTITGIKQSLKTVN
jgi:hypothetical protein